MSDEKAPGLSFLTEEERHIQFISDDFRIQGFARTVASLRALVGVKDEALTAVLMFAREGPDNTCTKCGAHASIPHVAACGWHVVKEGRVLNEDEMRKRLDNG